MEFGNMTAAENSIISALQAAVSGGLFTAYLRAFAVQAGTNALTSSSSSELTVLSNTQFPTLSPTSHPEHSNKLSSGATAAIVVCTVIGVAFLVLLVCCSRREESASAEREMIVVHRADTNGQNAN
jgi:hypothetical protein